MAPPSAVLLRTFLILVTVVAVPLAVIGSIKFKAYSYRNAIAELQTNGIEVRRIRTDDAASWWQNFVQDWIDNDAYAGDSVEVTFRGKDLTAADVSRLNAFAEIRSIGLASPHLTDATLLELLKLKHPSSLTIRDGKFTRKGLAAIPEFKALKSLDLVGLVLDDECLKALAPALDVDELALNIHDCSGKVVGAMLNNKEYKRLVLESSPQALPPTARSPLGSRRFAPCDFYLPPCGSLFLKNFSLDDDVLRNLSERTELRSIVLWNCEMDAGLALRIFATKKRDAASETNSERPVLGLGEFVEASAMGPDEIKLLERHPSICSVTIHKLEAPSESIGLLIENRKLRVIVLPEDVPESSLLKILRAKKDPMMAVNIISKNQKLRERLRADHSLVDAGRELLSVERFLQERGIDSKSIREETSGPTSNSQGRE